MKKAFHGGGGIYKVTGLNFEHMELGKNVVNADGLDAWFDPSPRAVVRLSEHLPLAIKTSPPIHAQGLIEAISMHRGLPKENIIVSGGSSDLMYELFPALSFGKAVILDPMYGEYSHIFSNVLTEVEVVRYNLLPEKDFDLNPDDFSTFIHQQAPDLVMIVNPNSPAGKFLKKREILQIVENLPEDCLLVIDETYVDYVNSEESVEREVPNHENLIVIKSMSKAYSLSGARVGYLVAPLSLVDQIEKLVPPFAVNTMAQLLAIECLRDTRYYKQKWQETRELRDEFVQDLETIADIRIYPGEGNFTLIELIGKNRNQANRLVKELAEKSIFIRNANSMSNRFDGNFLRITIKDRDTNKKIVNGIKEIL